MDEIKITYAEEKARGAVLKVIGVGGAGGNAINRMIEDGLDGVEFIAVNTDVQDLNSISEPAKTLQIGAKLTKGLGTGSNAEIGNQSAQESTNEIMNVVEGANMVFVTAGMGGGTGTGASPVIANHASSMGILTVAVVTKPFEFEGNSRMEVAEDGIEKLMESVDSIIVIPNEKLFELEDDDLSIEEAYKKIDSILLKAVQGISSIINTHGVNNTDFADVKAVMTEKGMTLMGTGEAKGDNRAEEAVNKALTSPLLGNVSIKGATGVLYNITAANIGLKELNVISRIISENVSNDVKISKYGIVKDDKMEDTLRVTVIATGFSNDVHETADPFEGMSHTMVNTSLNKDRKDKRYEFDTQPRFNNNAGFEPRRERAEKPKHMVREEITAPILNDFHKSDYLNQNSIPHMGDSESFGDDILDAPTFIRAKVTEKK